jgi:lipopolysaccharide export system permease protein
MNFQPGDNSPAWTVIAAEAELQSNLEKNTLRIIMTDCEVDVAGARTVLPGRTVQEIPLALASAKGEVKGVVPAHLPLSQIGAETERQVATVRQLEQSLAATNGLALITGQFDDLNDRAWRHRQMTLDIERLRLNKLRTEPYRRWAGGFSSLCFVFLGAPVAMYLRKSDLMSTFGLIFVPILFLYYPFFMFGFDQAKSGVLPPYSVWAANLVMVLVGLWWLRRVVRY